MKNPISLLITVACIFSSKPIALSAEQLSHRPRNHRKLEYFVRGQSFAELVRTGIKLSDFSKRSHLESFLIARQREKLNRGPIGAKVQIRDANDGTADLSFRTVLRFERATDKVLPDEAVLREIAPPSALPLFKSGLARARRYLAKSAINDPAAQLIGVELMIDQVRQRIISGNNGRTSLSMFFAFKNQVGVVQTGMLVAFVNDPTRKPVFKGVSLDRQSRATVGEELNDGWDGVFHEFNLVGGW